MTKLRGVRVIAVLCCAIAAALSIADAAAERRVALIIGNSAYAEAPLRNPVNDARAMAAVLRDLDFDVALLENADRVSMQRASLDFARKLKDDVVGLFYFAGHGMQVRGNNYLIPIGATVAGEDEVEVEAMDVNYVLARMSTAKNQFNIVILDACRNNPFERMFRSASSGLAAISAPRGTLIAYATAPGSVAADGHGANGLYTGELVSALRTPNLPLEQTFKLARAEVLSKSNGRQTPWESSSVVGNFVFRPQAGAPAVEDADTALWNAVKDSSDPADYRAYLDAQPKGVYVALARRRIEVLSTVRDEQISKAARDAANKAAQEALARTQKLEAEAAARAASQTKVASLSPAAAAFDKKSGDEYVKANWATIERGIRAHFHNTENRWLYNSMAKAPDPADLKLDRINYYDLVGTSGASIEVVALLNSYYMFYRYHTWVPQPAGIFVKYRLVPDGSDVRIVEFEPLPRSAVIKPAVPGSQQ